MALWDLKAGLPDLPLIRLLSRPPPAATALPVTSGTSRPGSPLYGMPTGPVPVLVLAALLTWAAAPEGGQGQGRRHGDGPAVGVRAGRAGRTTRGARRFRAHDTARPASEKAGG
ncbi:hypothetical protein ACIRFH_34515 [Streptomyces sp. NPDC093586]|uniref:hypothetical protein n=1 Tax=Streptomyces sp. NPDC093586 TaxID=3366042 RepID=UPI00380D90F0